MAVTHADHIIKLQEDLAGDEMPPEWMWPLSWEMETHLEKVIADRKARYGTDADDGDDSWDENELATEWKKAAL